jgi:hypothetical protein
MLKALALAEQSVVPIVRNNNVKGLKLGVSVVLGESISGAGYKAYVAMAVRTTSIVNRGLESERNAERWRRKGLVCEAACVASREDASGGSGFSPRAAAAAASAAAFSRR